MIDPMVSLAFAIYSNKGAYALLLGSGISRASGIPTGWEVVIDLIRKVAKLQNADCEPDPADWFRTTHGTEPDYSSLLDAIAKTPTERQQLLRGYFEPTGEERTQGLKLPTAAHKAIAQLVVGGFLRVIITTNFDRLTEMALEEVGIRPTVISTTDQIAGSLPLAHSGVTIIKLHGDYLDSRIKNTEQELAVYDEPLNQLLDRVLDEYGLIISGWSGDWDMALRNAITRCPSRRFSTFWTARSPLSEKAKSLADHRQAVVLQTNDANHLFGTLLEKVQSLDDLHAPHPLSAKIAVATVKRYLVEPAAKIRLRDLIHEETERLFGELNAPDFRVNNQTPHQQEFMRRVNKYDSLCETMIAMLVTGCHWGDEGATTLWTNAIQRIAIPTKSDEGSRYECWLMLRRYPTLLLIYGAGLASVASGNYGTLASILTKPKAFGDSDKKQDVCAVIYSSNIVEANCTKWLSNTGGQTISISQHIYAGLRGPLREYLPRDEDYQYAFDRFEYLYGLVVADMTQWEQRGGWWGPVGSYIRRIHSPPIQKQIETEIHSEGVAWPLLKAGLFGGSLDQLTNSKTKFDLFLEWF